MSALEDAAERLLSQWEAFAADPGPGEPAFLRQWRRENRDRFAEQGFPTTKQEEWRYTPLRGLAGIAFERPDAAAPVTREQVEAISFPVFACSLFVFVNGRHVPELSSPRALSGGLRVESLARLGVEAPERLEGLLPGPERHKAHPLAALGAAFLEDGALVTIPRGAQVEHAIHLVFVSTGERPAATHPRVVIRAEPGSRARVIQDHVSLAVAGADPGHWSNAVTDLHVDADARLDWVLLQRESSASYATSNTAVRLERNARFAAHTVTLGGLLVRNDLEATLADEGAECTLNGLFLGTGQQVVDNHTLVDHAMPHCRSEELYKGILADRARGVFRGRVIVRPDAQKTDARQSNPNLLLGDGAEIDTKPQLEIYADDVKCSHGSAIGRMDPDALFYLRTRGIGPVAARALLTRGFAQEILGQLPHEALVDALGATLTERLEAVGVGS